MEITSFGAASKAASDFKKIKKELGPRIEGRSSTLKKRLDQIEIDIKQATKLTDSLIIQNAINLSKAEAKVNTIAKTTKEKMEQMIFDDLFDLDAINIDASSYSNYDDVLGRITGGIVVTEPIDYGDIKKLLFDVSGGTIEISINNNAWQSITNNEIYYLTEAEEAAGTSFVAKIDLGSSGVLDYYSILWSK